MSSLRAPLQDGPYKKQKHRTAQNHAEHQDATDIEKKIFKSSLLYVQESYRVRSKVAPPTVCSMSIDNMFS